MDLVFMDENFLRCFEDDVAQAFNEAKIKAPVHLYSNNEKQLIEIFTNIHKNDWVFCSWRSHYQCLLKGVPPEQVMQKIMNGQSISLCFPEHKIYSSAIVGGIIPIAVGVAKAMQIKGQNSMVHCFLGDMTAETGIAHECIKYSANFKLPIRFIIEDNNKSVVTDTRKAWGNKVLSTELLEVKNVQRYFYNNRYPHAGAGKRVQF